MPQLIAPISEPLAPIPDYLPGGQPHFISGPSGVGKTAFLASWAVAFRDGTPIFNKPTNKMPWIGLISTDRCANDTLKWFKVAGFPDIPTYSAIDDFDGFDFFALRNPKLCLDKLNKLLDRLGVPEDALVLVDPISWVSGGDLNRYNNVFPALGSLGQLCLKRRMTILGLAHTAKQHADAKENYARPQDKILGSMALLGGSGTQMGLEGPVQTGVEGEFRFSWNPHHALEEIYMLTRDANGLFVPMADKTKSLLPSRPEILACIPADPPIAPKALLGVLVQAQCEVSRPTLFRYLEEYRRLGLVEKTEYGQYRRVAPTLQ